MTKIKDYIRGDSRVIAVPVTKTDGSAFDLTGSTVFFTVNANTNNTADNDSSAAIALKASSFVCPVACTIDGVNYTVNQDTTILGIAWLTITNAISQDITPEDYFYDVQLKDSSGHITSIKQDTFTIIPDVTRSIS